MSLFDLKDRYRDRVYGSEFGEDAQSLVVKFNLTKPPAGTSALREALCSFFKIRSLDMPTSIHCLSDVMRDLGSPDHYQRVSGVYFVGLYFAQSARGTEAPCNFFIRKTDGFRGTMDMWKDDIVFPIHVTRYTVCALVPEDFSFSERGKHDPRNYRVPTLSISDAKLKGLDLVEILSLFESEVKADEKT